MIIADDFGALGDFIWRLYVIAAFAALLLSFVAAAYGATQQGATIKRKVSAVLCGCPSGVFVAAIVGVALLSTNSPAGFVLGLVLGPLFGGAMSYVVARTVASVTKPSAE